jgi:hypothetical protein
VVGAEQYCAGAAHSDQSDAGHPPDDQAAAQTAADVHRVPHLAASLDRFRTMRQDSGEYLPSVWPDDML